MRRLGFTMIELIFVIVIMGILSKFGIEFLAQAYKSFMYSSINNAMQAKSAAAVESIAARLQFRIKDSIIARDVTLPGLSFQALASSTLEDNATVLEWVGSDIENFRGDLLPNWSGIIDLDPSTNTILKSPDTNTTALNNMILTLSDGGSTIDDAALYFVGSDSDINQYGWDGIALNNHSTSVMHPINDTGNIDEFISAIAPDFNGTDVYEYYQLAWTAYAVEHNVTSGDLILHYDYQPWTGKNYRDDGKAQLLMENVDTFRFKAVGSIVKIQVCVNTPMIDGTTDGGYSLCKEKTIY